MAKYDWPAAPAAINAFGFGGVNAHVLIEDVGYRGSGVGSRVSRMRSSDTRDPETRHPNVGVTSDSAHRHRRRGDCARLGPGLPASIAYGASGDDPRPGDQWPIDAVAIPLIARLGVPPSELQAVCCNNC